MHDSPCPVCHYEHLPWCKQVKKKRNKEKPMSWFEDNKLDIDVVIDFQEKQEYRRNYYEINFGKSFYLLAQQLQQYKDFFNPKYKTMVLDIIDKVLNDKYISSKQQQVLVNTYLYTEEIWEDI